MEIVAGNISSILHVLSFKNVDESILLRILTAQTYNLLGVFNYFKLINSSQGQNLVLLISFLLGKWTFPTNV